MSSRRAFLNSAAVTVAAAALPRVSGAQQSSAPLPPSIAALQSMKSQATPITNAERLQRIEQARRLMTQNGLDAIAMMGGTSLIYFSNIRWWNSERLFLMILPAKGDAFYVCPAFEEDRAREQIGAGPLGAHADVRTWQEDEDPYALVAAGLQDRGIAAGRLGIEEKTYFNFADGVAHASPALKVVSATPVTAGCRMIKSAHEIALMRLASAVTLKAYAAAFTALHDGMTQDQFAALVSAAHTRLGFSGGAGAQVGVYSALPHGSVTPQVIKEGSIILIDGGCTVEGYSSDLSRTFVLGKATDKMKALFDIVHRAQKAALDAARPGVPLDVIDAAARRVVTDAGYGPGFKYFTHRVGHGLGMDVHEWPYLAKNNMFGWTRSLAARPGMTFSDEPGIYIRGEFGVRLEDDLLITDQGAELLTPQSASIEKPFEGVS
ncbi:MAG: M24 family metallopeptidase [Bacteroidales bacterium]